MAMNGRFDPPPSAFRAMVLDSLMVVARQSNTPYLGEQDGSTVRHGVIIWRGSRRSLTSGVDELGRWDGLEPLFIVRALP
jgi:hypothetical protein